MSSASSTPVPSTSSVIIADPQKFEEKRKKFLADGKDSLQVIADFDFTLTRFWINGKRGFSSHGVIEHSTTLGPEFSERTHQLFATYYPIEINPDVPADVKKQKMVEWWSKAHDLMLEYGLKKHHIKEMFIGANIDIREGCGELLQYLSDEKIPLLVFSAGIANVLKEFLAIKQVYHPNIHVVSNLMHFDEQTGALLAFEGEMIHSMNKNAHILDKVGADWAHDKKRKHILLLGDNLMDVHMSEGLEFSEIITVGFLNDKIEERLEIYKKTFDVVVVNDGSMEVVQNFVKEVVAGGRQ